MDERTFIKIAEACEARMNVSRSTDFSSMLCPDDSTPRHVMKFGDVECQLQSSMILVLESPHIDEYRGPGAPRAANGVTGGAICTLLNTVVETSRFDLSGMVDVYVMNAVPLQCSLGHSNRAVRDCVFSACWERSEVVDDFAKRLTVMLTRLKGQTTVINACTSGPGGARRRAVEAEIQKLRLAGNFRSYKLEHPSNWARRHNQKQLKGAPELRYQWKS